MKPSVYLKGTEGGDASLHHKKGVKSGREQQPAHKIFGILYLKSNHKNLLCVFCAKQIVPAVRMRCTPVSMKTVYMELNRKAIHYIIVASMYQGTKEDEINMNTMEMIHSMVSYDKNI